LLSAQHDDADNRDSQGDQHHRQRPPQRQQLRRQVTGFMIGLYSEFTGMFGLDVCCDKENEGERALGGR
jgi:hypothetical protein